MNIVQMQVTGINSTQLRKWFFDNVPNPLPQPGDYINTYRGRYYVLNTTNFKEPQPEQKIDERGTILRINSCIFVLNENNEWIVQLSCS